MSAPPFSPIIISLDGNIGAGKSTLLQACKASLGEKALFIDEPVGEWLTMKNEKGESLLSLFYSDKKRWSYTFQLTALLTRLKATQEVVALAKEKGRRVIITERSVSTDRHVFAEMLRDSGDLDSLEWTLYLRWFEQFGADIPIKALILLTTGSETSHSRIASRGRDGEQSIPLEYIAALGEQHEKWADTTNLPVLRVSTETNESTAAAVTEISAFIDQLLEMDAATAAGSPTAAVDFLPVTQKSDAARLGVSTFGGSPISAHSRPLSTEIATG